MAEGEDRDDSKDADGDTKRADARSKQRTDAKGTDAKAAEAKSDSTRSAKSDSKSADAKAAEGERGEDAATEGAANEGDAPRRKRKRRRRGTGDIRQALPRIATRVASVVLIIGAAFALIHVANIIFVGFDANRENAIVKFVMTLADALALGLTDLFTPMNLKLRVLINGGLAAIVWLVLAAVLGRLLRKIG